MKTIVNYAQKVKEQHALNKTLAPVETDLTDASRSYAIGEQFINDGDLFRAKTPIAQHDALVLNTNYEAADDITTQIKNKTVTTDPVPTEGSTNPVQSNGVFVENRNIYEVMGEMGAKNLLNNTASTKTENGVTYTVNSDKSVTFSGTATDFSGLVLCSNQKFKAGKYILSGIFGSTGLDVVNIKWDYLSLYDASNTLVRTINLGNETDAELVIDLTNDVFDNITLALKRNNNTACSGTAYPMLRLYEDKGTEYQPYAKTNQQLTAENEALTNQLTNEVTTRAALGAHNLFGVGNSLDEWFAATNDGKLPTSYLASETITGTVDKDTNSIVITAYNNTGYRWGCKKINLKKNTSYTFSRTSCDGTIQLFGKNNADDRAVVISGLSNGGTVNSGDYDWWYVGFYPTRSGGYFSITDLLVRLETDADTTYQPYAKTNQELTAENQTLTNEIDTIVNNLNVKNILPNLAASTTKNGVTFTVNSDGTVTVNGTASAYTQFDLNTEVEYKKGTYKLNGCPSGGGSQTYVLWVRNLAVTVGVTDGGNGATLNVTNADTFKASIIVYSGAIVNNLTFYPMLRPASIEDDTYVPYSMTNRELTEKIDRVDYTSKITWENDFTWAFGSIVEVNDIIYFSGLVHYTGPTQTGTSENPIKMATFDDDVLPGYVQSSQFSFTVKGTTDELVAEVALTSGNYYKMLGFVLKAV